MKEHKAKVLGHETTITEEGGEQIARLYKMYLCGVMKRFMCAVFLTQCRHRLLFGLHENLPKVFIPACQLFVFL